MAYYIRFRGLGDVPILPNSAAQGYAFESRCVAPLIAIPRTRIMQYLCSSDIARSVPISLTIAANALDDFEIFLGKLYREVPLCKPRLTC